MVPLQFELAGIFIVIALVSLLLTIGGTYWVYKDASRRGNDNVALWTIATLAGFVLGGFILGPGIMIVYYFVGRDEDTPPQYGDVDEEWN